MTKTLRNEKGTAVPIVAIALLAIIATAAVGVDTGRIAFVATETQTAADVAATAGANGLLRNESAIAAAIEVLELNSVDGAEAATTLVALEEGHFALGAFTLNGLPRNAVRATTQITATNVVSGALGHPTSTVAKGAVATFTGTSKIRPTLPIALGECHFDGDCYESSCMPDLIQTPSDAQNSGWTGFFDTANNANIRDMLDYSCGGGDVQIPEVEIGDTIELNNGQLHNLLVIIDCMVSSGNNEFIIPIVPCMPQYNQSAAVVGFATVRIADLRYPGNQTSALTNSPAGGGDYAAPDSPESYDSVSLSSSLYLMDGTSLNDPVTLLAVDSSTYVADGSRVDPDGTLTTQGGSKLEAQSAVNYMVGNGLTPHGIILDAIFSTEVPGSPGGPNFGTGSVALVK